MANLINRCNLLGASIENAAGSEEDPKPLSEDLKDSIGRLVVYVSFFECLVNHSNTYLATGEYRIL